MRSSTLLAVLAVVVSVPAVAASDALSPGSRIRWTTAAAPGPARIGRAMSLAPDTLVALADPDSSRVALALSSLSSLERSLGQPNRSARYALVGGLAGGLTGIGVLALLDWAVGQALEGPVGPSESTNTSAYILAGLAGVGVGAACGAVVGARLRDPERWQVLNVAGVQMGARLRPESSEVCLTVRYGAPRVP